LYNLSFVVEIEVGFEDEMRLMWCGIDAILFRIEGSFDFEDVCFPLDIGERGTYQLTRGKLIVG
jgi:hypothetical protein